LPLSPKQSSANSFALPALLPENANVPNVPLATSPAKASPAISAQLEAILKKTAPPLAPNALQDPTPISKGPPPQLLANNAPQARFLAALALNLALNAMLELILHLKAPHLHPYARIANQANIVMLALHSALNVLKGPIQLVLAQDHALLAMPDVILHK